MWILGLESLKEEHVNIKGTSRKGQSYQGVGRPEASQVNIVINLVFEMN